MTSHPHEPSVPTLMVLDQSTDGDQELVWRSHLKKSQASNLSHSTSVKNLISRYSDQAKTGAPPPSSLAPLAVRPHLRISASQDSLVPNSSQPTSKPAGSGLGLSPTAGPLNSLAPLITVTSPMKDQKSLEVAPHNMATHQVGKTEDRSPASTGSGSPANSGLGSVSWVHCRGAMAS